MTISKINFIGSIGRFRDASASGDVTFKKYTLLFGENGRGKTTLCSILRSLQTNKPEIIIGRKTLGAGKDPNVQIALGTGRAAFMAGEWKAPPTQIRIFDAQYVSDNIFSGDVIGTNQRRNLCRVILGANGVDLANKYYDVDNAITAKNAEIRDARRPLTQHVPTGEIPNFLSLQADPDVDTKIAAKSREVEGLMEIDKLRERPGLQPIDIPPLPKLLGDMLARTLEDVSNDAEKKVKEHLAHHAIDGEQEWIGEGLTHMTREECPFCGQSTKGLPLIKAYKAYFTEAYMGFRGEIEKYRANAARLFVDDRIEMIDTRIASNVNGADVWSRYLTFTAPRMPDDANIAEALTMFRTEMLGLLDKKLAAPLDAVSLPPSYLTAYKAFEKVTEVVTAYNKEVAQANAAIEAYKKSANVRRSQIAEKELAGLRLVKKRHEPGVDAACVAYNRLNAEKNILDEEKVKARESLDGYSADVLTRYEKAINANLRTFTAGFHLSEVRVEYTGRTPNSTFCAVINDEIVPMAGADTPLDEPSFRNTLSAGDRSTLALAFFLAELAADPHRANAVVVFDDPFNSQDHYRRTCTISEIRRCGRNVAQVIVMSHDRRFLREIWDLPLPTEERKALSLNTVGRRDTVIAEWDIEHDTETEDAANRRILDGFHRERRGKPRDVIQKLRPVIETHIHRIAPQQMEGITGLGKMLAKINDDPTVPPPLKSAYDEIDDVNTYTRGYMHGESEYADTKPISEDELGGFVEKVLMIVGH
jgi:wobble nucleotide-excising tRNase